MKNPTPFYSIKSNIVLSVFFVVVFSFNATGQSLQWHNYVADESVMDFVMDGNNIWVASFGGVMKLDKLTGTHVNYNGGVYGLRENAHRRIAMDKYGHLFIAAGGFVHTFDQLSAWSYFSTHPVTGLAMPHFNLLEADRLGNVYATTNQTNYITRYNAGVWDTIGLPLPSMAYISAMDTDTLNHLWVATTTKGILKYDGTSWQVFDSTNTILPSQHARGITIDHNGKVHVIYYHNPPLGRFYTYDNGVWSYNPANIPMSNTDIGLWPDTLGNIWIYNIDGIYPVLRKFDGNTVTQYSTASSGIMCDKVNRFASDHNGVWYYTCGNGLYSFDGTAHKHFELSNSGLPYSGMEEVAIDKFGTKWFCSYAGVTRFDGISWETFNADNSALPVSNISDILIDDANGLVWASFQGGFSSAGVAYYDGSTWTPLTSTQAGGLFNVSCMTADINGNIWFAGTDRVSMYDYNGWTHHTNLTGYTSLSFWGIEADSMGNVFVPAWNSGVWMYNGSSWQFFDATYFGGTPGGFGFSKGVGGRVVTQNSSGYFEYNGTTWVPLVTPCIVNSVSTGIPVRSSAPGFWLSDNIGTSCFNGTGCTEYTQSELPDLSNGARSVAIDKHNNYWFTYSGGGGVTVYNPEGINPESLTSLPSPSVSGFVFSDYLSDGIYDSITDLPFSNQKILLLPDSIIRYTNSAGRFNFRVDPGSYTIRIIPSGNWQVTGDSLEYHVAVTASDTSGFDFGLMDPTAPPDEMGIIITNGIPRCNTEFPIWINYQNTGILTHHGMLRLTLDSLLQFVSSVPQPDSISGQECYWQISNLGFYQSGVIAVSVASGFATPPFAHQVNVDFIKQGVLHTSATSSFTQFCSYDPNDKQVSPLGNGLLHEVALGQELHYTIRFQNYGNDTAFYVFIIDTLDADLDYSTFKVKGSSHTCDVTLTTGGRLRVNFPGIKLLWEAVNASASQGYFSYSISQKPNLPDSTFITNTAAIFFDLNPPIITNEVFNMVLSTPLSTNEIPQAAMITVRPVPASDFVVIGLRNKMQPERVVIMDLHGRILDLPVGYDDEVTLQTSGLQSGVYLIRAVTKSGEWYHSRFIISQ